MKKIRIVGVPEHFNLPWHMALEEGAFENRGIDIRWTDIPEGTGRMCQMLQHDETDLAIVLTEGIVNNIALEGGSKIVQEYVSSPLLWAIHVASVSNRTSVSQLEKDPIAISRMGSGSHLMAYVHAQDQKWNTEILQFDIINNLQGAVESLSSGSGAYFLWEYFTTKPLVEQGIFKRLGHYATPWPCFVIAANESFLVSQPGVVRHVLEVINRYTSEFKHIPSIDRTLANRYGQRLEDIQDWLSKTNWGNSQISSDVLNRVQDRLLSLDLIKNIKPEDTFLYNLV
ncbi:MAG: substrate-binding domain-containing protein [Bacteroidota bacterium]